MKQNLLDRKNQKGIASLLFLFAALGVIVFLGLEALAPFRNQLLSALYRKNTSFAAGTVETNYNLGVLAISYFPVNASNAIDTSVTGDVGESYDSIRQKTIAITNNLLNFIPKATTYLGYKDPTALPAINLTLIETKEFKKPVPILADGSRKPDYNKILTDQNICEYVNNRNVREVFLWAYQGPTYPGTNVPYLNISESKMSGPFGDISNSYRENNMPKCLYTYRVYTFNYGRGTAEAIHSWGHQIEAELSEINTDLFRTKWQGVAYPPVVGVTGRCGSVHNPPNARSEYDYVNPTPYQSDCLDWNPDGLGQTSNISCSLWGCQEISDSNNPQLNYIIWNYQNLPGKNNAKFYQGKKLRNLWDIHGDFDKVMTENKTVFSDPLASPTPTPVPVVANLTLSPSSIIRGTPIKLSWTYTSGAPSLYDQFEVVTSNNVHAQSFYAGNCSINTPSVLPLVSGQCQNAIATANYGGPATYTVKMYKNADPKQVIGRASFTIIGNSMVSVTTSPQSVKRGAPMSVNWNYNGITPMLYDQFQVLTSTNVHAQAFFAGSCSPTGPKAAPTAVGSCASAIPTANYGPGTYTIRFYQNANPQIIIGTTTFTISP